MANVRESWLVSGLCRLYRFSLLLYPRAFRERFGKEMLQVFSSHCRDVLASRGLWGLLAAGARILADIFASVLREWITGLAPQSVLLALASVASGLFAAYVDFHSVEVQAPALVVMISAFVFSVLRPNHAWRWALAAGLSIFLAHSIAPVVGMVPVAPPLSKFGALVAVIPALVGAYAGVVAKALAGVVAARWCR